MAELNTQEGNRRQRGGIRSKKLSTRVDLTPMVDLGFLLITFFIFTTTLHELRGMGVIVPADNNERNDPSLAPEGKTLSLILQGNDVIRYYHGLNTEASQATDYSVHGLHALVQQKIESVRKTFGNRGEAIILIKPTDGATYSNVVNVLDEMRINDVKKYVLMDPSTAEKNL